MINESKIYMNLKLVPLIAKKFEPNKYEPVTLNLSEDVQRTDSKENSMN